MTRNESSASPYLELSLTDSPFLRLYTKENTLNQTKFTPFEAYFPFLSASILPPTDLLFLRDAANSFLLHDAPYLLLLPLYKMPYEV